jgi:hypothetical protein
MARSSTSTRTSQLDPVLAAASMAGGLLALFLDRRYLHEGFEAGLLGAVTTGVVTVLFPVAHGLPYRQVVLACAPVFLLLAGLSRLIGYKLETLLAYPLLTLGAVGVVMILRASAAAPRQKHEAPPSGRTRGLAEPGYGARARA